MATGYIVELSPEAQADLGSIPVFHRAPVLKALVDLEHQAHFQTRQRKPLTAPLEDLPDASWEVRVGQYRVLYQVTSVQAAQGDRRTAWVLRVIFKGTSTMQEALSRAKKP